LDDLEMVACQLPALQQTMLARLQTETTPHKLGAHNWKEVLKARYRITGSEANRRLADTEMLAPRQALTGQPLPPVLAITADTQALGVLTPGHVEVIRKAVAKLPGWVDGATRERVEADLVRAALGVDCDQLASKAKELLYRLDQDGPVPDDTERARRRSATHGKQGEDGMTTWRLTLTPECHATFEALLAKLAAPGMCNPDDPQPCVSGTPAQAQIDNDHRTLAQRQHDALLAIGRIALMGGDLGTLNGLPVSVIIRVTLEQLESRAGLATTGGGTKLPISDVLRMAAHAHHHLAVFDGATGSALAHFRGKRVATPAQRIMLIARDGGCTKPGCTVGAYGCQAHHAEKDWIDGGNTNVDEMALACPPHNRLVDTDNPTAWTTHMTDKHHVAWIPPDGLDNGQPRINTIHQPELLLADLTDRDDEDEEPDSGTPVPQSDSTQTDNPRTEPGGPAPPTNGAA
ncbi:HNH endonuclease signature motif containing protein, partial [Mycolicibacterium phlei]